jgi:DNA-binding NarL/FixJ family response regulator
LIEKSILVVDNHPASRHELANFLKAKEFKVLETSTEREGLITVWRHAPGSMRFDPTLAGVLERFHLETAQ